MFLVLQNYEFNPHPLRIITLQSVDSTNNYAQIQLNAGIASEGDVFLALEQTSGRGQRGNHWLSTPGEGLYASIVLKPFINAGSQFLLNKCITCSVVKYLKIHSHSDIRIKWPNDILADGKKIAGILIENSLRGDSVSAVIAGIGINLNQQYFHGNFGIPPVSLHMLTGEYYHAEKEIYSLAEIILKDYSVFKEDSGRASSLLFDELLAGKREFARFSGPDGIFEARILEVDDEGEAILDTGNKIIRARHPVIRYESGNSA